MIPYLPPFVNLGIKWDNKNIKEVFMTGFNPRIHIVAIEDGILGFDVKSEVLKTYPNAEVCLERIETDLADPDHISEMVKHADLRPAHVIAFINISTKNKDVAFDSVIEYCRRYVPRTKVGANKPMTVIYASRETIFHDRLHDLRRGGYDNLLLLSQYESVEIAKSISKVISPEGPSWTMDEICGTED